MMLPCSEVECDRPIVARGLCRPHYARCHRLGILPADYVSPCLPSPIEGFLGRIQRSANGCWIWTGHIERNGYGKITLYKRGFWAHRAAYELLVGPIPEDDELDHRHDLCGDRACVKVVPDGYGPAHLEPVTGVENRRRAVDVHRRPSCPQGHPFDEYNTLRSTGRGRRCRICHRLRERARYQNAAVRPHRTDTP